jgi:putative radical SAM enzyme (TIGR03279 family)
LIEIVDIDPQGTAAGLDIQKGDSIVSINGEEVLDVIDYKFLAAEEQIKIKLHTRDSRSRTVSVHKNADDMLGLEFAPFPVKRCRNKCIFCFVDQMPGGCRKSLYVKDDDYRASFLYGNYITLGALNETDWQRIFRLRLSPLYLSVHTTDHELRSFMLGNRTAPDILAGMKRLASHGIRMHTQIVLCPGINDRDHLKRTIYDLASLFPAVASIAVVPVGMTAFRKSLFTIRPFSVREARTVIETVTKFGTACKKKFGERIVFASDEFYIKAKVPVPPPRYYEDFPQIENGVGMVADFFRGAARTRLPAAVGPVKVTLVTGVSFAKILKEATAVFRNIRGVTLNLVTVRNVFFGSSVTVAGLLTGSDIAAALAGRRLGDLVVVPSESLNDKQDLFLDGMSLEQLGNRLGVRTLASGSFKELIALLKREGRKKNDDHRQNQLVRHLRLSRGTHILAGHA